MYGVKDVPFDGWIGVVLDGTLAIGTEHEINNIGEPIPEMAERLLRWHRAGFTVKIFTARACFPNQVPLIKAWLAKHNLPDLEVTNMKDGAMFQLWDDRAVEVVRDTGRPANPARRMTDPTFVL